MANHLEEVAQDTVSKTSASAFGVIRDLTSTRGLFFAGGMAMTGNPALATAGLIGQAVLRSPGTPIKIAKGLNKISKYITENQEGLLTQRIMLAINNTDNPEELQKSVGGFIAEINLKENNVERSAESIFKNQQNIGSVLRTSVGPEVANDFHKAIESGDPSAPAAFVDTAVKKGMLKGMVSDGLGIDGKVFSQEDKAMLESKIRNSGIQAVQRIKMIEELRTTGKIPDFNSVQPRQPKQYGKKTEEKQY